MAAESKMTMTFDASAEGVVRAYDQMEQGGLKMTRQTIEGMRNAAQAIKLVTDQLLENNVATKRLMDQNENLKRQLDELKTKNEELAHYTEMAKKGFEALGVSLSISGILEMIHKFVEAQEKWNKEIINTQVEYDKVARKLQVQALLKDEEFKHVRDKVIAPIASQYNFGGLDQPTELYSALRSQGVEEKHIPEVMKQVIEGGRAIPGMADEQLPDFAIAMVRQAQQRGWQAGQIDQKVMSRMVIPATNMAGALRMRTGGEFMAMQESVGNTAEGLGLDPNELMAEVAALGPHVGKDKAAQGIQKTLLRLKSEKAQEAMGENVAAAFNEKLNQGSVIGAFSTLGDALNQLSPEDREKKMAQLFPARQGLMGRQLLMHQQEAWGIMQNLGDTTRIEQAQDIAAHGPDRNQKAVALSHQLAKLRESELAERNETLLGFFEAEMERRHYSEPMKGLMLKPRRWMAAAGKDLLPEFQARAGEGNRLFAGAQRIRSSYNSCDRTHRGRTMERSRYSNSDPPAWDDPQRFPALTRASPHRRPRISHCAHEGRPRSLPRKGQGNAWTWLRLHEG